MASKARFPGIGEVSVTLQRLALATTSKRLLIDADGALYQAKREGRNRVAVFRSGQARDERAASSPTAASNLSAGLGGS